MRAQALLTVRGSCAITMLVLVATATTASAQSPRDPGQGDAKAEQGGTSKISVSLPSAEIVGGNQVAPPPPPLSLEQPIDPDAYVCGVGDVFELDFWGTQNFRITVAIDLEGRAFIAKVGFISVVGKSLATVRTTMKAKVHTIYPGLTFDLTLVSPRSFLVHVVDNVKAPGAYTSRALERVSAALGKAGGPTGSRRRIQIKHRDGTTSTADLVRYELTGDTTYNPYLLDGDVISVPFANPVVSIGGPVRRPGNFELIATKDLAELLDLAGGFGTSVNRSLPLRLLRRNAQQQLATTELPFTGDNPPNLPLQDQDQIVVRGSDELQRTVLVIGAVAGADSLDPATTSARIAYVEGDTVRSVIERAGGIKSSGDLRRSYISRARRDQPPELIALDLEALLVHRDFSVDRPIKMDDTIVIPPVLYSVLVEGAVAHSGLYNYNPTFGISEYIARAGGRTRTAREIEEVQLIDTSGQTHPYHRGMRPSPGDAILVPESNFSRSEIAQLVLAGAGIVLSGLAVTIAATR